MYYQWTTHLKDQEEKDRFKKYIYGSKGVLERLNQILDLEEEALTSREITEATYDNPSWAALQADRNGYRRALRYIKSVINLDQRENNGQSV